MTAIGRIAIPEGTPMTGLHLRIIDGCPVLFTERGEYVRGQRGCVVHARMDDVVQVDADILVERAP